MRDAQMFQIQTQNANESTVKRCVYGRVLPQVNAINFALVTWLLMHISGVECELSAEKHIFKSFLYFGVLKL